MAFAGVVLVSGAAFAPLNAACIRGLVLPSRKQKSEINTFCVYGNNFMCAAQSEMVDL